MQNTVLTWLKGIPGLEGLRLETLDAAPGACGLFCQGLKELGRRQDILGTVQCRRCLTFKLCLHSASREVPDFFLELDTAHAPVLGQDQTVAVTQGGLHRDAGSGICRYEATITFTFTSKG